MVKPLVHLYCSAPRTLAANYVFFYSLWRIFSGKKLDGFREDTYKYWYLTSFQLGYPSRHPTVKFTGCQVGEQGSHHSVLKLSHEELEMAPNSQQQYQNGGAIPSEFWGNVTSGLEPNHLISHVWRQNKGIWGVPDLPKLFPLIPS